MAETRITDIDFYRGINPTVFKKVDNNDVSFTPFQTNKLWAFYSGSVTSSCLPLFGIYSDINNLPALETELVYNDASNINGSLQTIIYQSINHLFYKNKNTPFQSFGPTNTTKISKFLYKSASVLSIPSVKIGEGIKPASFIFNGTASLKSDLYGNVYDSAFITSSIINGVKLYEGFNEYFDVSRISYEYSNVVYHSGVTTTNGSQLPIGLSAKFAGNGYIKQDISGNYDRDNNYAISFFISGGNTTISNELIIAKATSSLTPQYPFKIELSGSNQIVFTVAGSTSLNVKLASTASVSSSWNHVVCQKTGSTLEMYFNGILHASASSNLLVNTYSTFTASARIDNTQPVMIGGYSDSSYNLQGSLDEIRIYNKALTSAEVGYLADRTEGGTMLQTNIVGNVFSKQGLIVISSADYRYNDILKYPYTSSYRSTLTRYELGVVTKLDAGDFNLSLNPTLTKDDDITYHGFVSGSDFAPYITTIGLYNDAGQLLAIGKLAQPIRKRNDVDMNFLIRIDLDKTIIK
jgi:hypothetical protein